MTQTEFDVIRAAIKAAWPGYMVMNDKYSIRFWYAELGHLDLRIAEKAIQQLAATSKYPPQISDILQKAAEINGATFEPQEAKDSLPPVVRSAVEQVGYLELCNSANITADRAHFFRVYESLRTRAMDAEKMPPIAATPSERRLGHGNMKADKFIGVDSKNASAATLSGDGDTLAGDITRNDTDETSQKRRKDIEALKRRLLYGKENGGKAGEDHGD